MSKKLPVIPADLAFRPVRIIVVKEGTTSRDFATFSTLGESAPSQPEMVVCANDDDAHAAVLRTIPSSVCAIKYEEHILLLNGNYFHATKARKAFPDLELPADDYFFVWQADDAHQPVLVAWTEDIGHAPLINGRLEMSAIEWPPSPPDVDDLER